MKKIHLLTFTLLIVGGLNWLLLALFKWDIGMLFGGQGAMIAKIIYVLVGVSAVYEAATHMGRCKGCSKMDKMANGGTPAQQ